MTSESAPIPVPASVLFLRMRGWAGELPSEQTRRRARLAEALRSALAAWAADRRIVLDAPDGLAVVGEGDPATALKAARMVAQNAGDADLGIGLHHGPVRASGATPEDARLQGDGIDTAAALAAFAGTHPVVASQSFRDALSAQSPRAAEALRAAGEVVDERLRSHTLFVFDPQPARQRALRRNLFGILGLLVLLSAGLAGREARERYVEAHRPAVLVLDIQPAGEVFVDGEAKGSSPPLVRLSVPPGPHAIEVRSGRLPPLVTEVQLQPGEQMELKHVFVAPQPQRKPKAQAPHQPTPGERLDHLIHKYRFW